MILIDWSAISVACILGTAKSELNNFYEDKGDLLKHIIFNRLRMYNQKFSKEYGQIVLCLDSDNVWRSKYFKNYKCKRKAKKHDDKKIDWNTLLKISNSIIDILVDNFPYPVIKVRGAEGDDIIGVLARNYDEETVVISGDKDFNQLLGKKRIKQYDPINDKFITLTEPAWKVLLEHVIRGDTGDSIPNILSDDNVFAEGRRQKNIYVPYVEAFKERLLAKELTEEERKNWNRNVTLIDFNAIPKDLQQNIMNEYDNYVVKGTHKTLFDYLMYGKFKLLIDCANEF